MEKKSKLSTRKIVFTALMAALVFVGSALRVRLPFQPGKFPGGAETPNCPRADRHDPLDIHPHRDRSNRTGGIISAVGQADEGRVPRKKRFSFRAGADLILSKPAEKQPMPQQKACRQTCGPALHRANPLRLCPACGQARRPGSLKERTVILQSAAQQHSDPPFVIMVPGVPAPGDSRIEWRKEIMREG